MILKKEYANIKRAFENIFDVLLIVVKVIRNKNKDQLLKVYFQHVYNKNSNIEAIFNIDMIY